MYPHVTLRMTVGKLPNAIDNDIVLIDLDQQLIDEIPLPTIIKITLLLEVKRIGQIENIKFELIYQLGANVTI